VYRIPYERDPVRVPRQCVITSTTNDRTFLRNEVGNRRFLVVHCERKVDFTALTPEYVDQVWAEAMDLYLADAEPLFVNEEQAEQAAAVRAGFTEETPLVGYVEDYCRNLVPPGWDTMTRTAKREWFAYDGNTGTVPISRVCAAEVIEMVTNKGPGEYTQALTTQVTNALKQLPGWVPVGMADSGGYGRQLMFVRVEDLL
jgi:hypothetical protein